MYVCVERASVTPRSTYVQTSKTSSTCISHFQLFSSTSRPSLPPHARFLTCAQKKFSINLQTFGLALTLGLAAAIPQGLPAGIEDLPDCALNGLPQALSASGCPGIDPACLCSKPNLAAELTPAVDAACSDEGDRTKLKNFIAGFCPTTSAAEASPAPTEAPEASMAAAADASTTAEEVTSWTTSCTTMPVGVAMPTGSMTNGTNSTTPTYTTPVASSTASMPPASTGAASSFGASMMAAAVAMGGMTWVFAEL